ncbi:MAG TPA: uridine kinase [Halieaceae bacterium]|nr:uridine kinase [Halieaceae bacterium]
MVSIVVAIVGASGSGKSHLVASLAPETLGATVAVLRVDDYYRDLTHLSFEDRDAINFDHPDAIEFERLVDDLASLRSGEEVQTPVYDFTQHTRSALSQSVPPADIILLEGVLAMSDSATRTLVDYTIFVDTPLELCLARRIERDAVQRGRSEASVRDFWETRAEPMFAQFVAPWRSEADLVIDGSQTIDDELSRVGGWLQALIQDHQSL